MSISVHINTDKLAPLIKNETGRIVLLSAIFTHFIETCSIKNATVVHWGVGGWGEDVLFQTETSDSFMGTHAVISNKQNKFQTKPNSNKLVK